MFGLSPQEKLIRKMKRSGVTVTGDVTEITERSLQEEWQWMQEIAGVELPDFMNPMTNPDGRSIMVTVTYRTKEGTEEKMYLRVKDASPYQVGASLNVRYLYEKKENAYLAIPESEIKSR